MSAIEQLAELMKGLPQYQPLTTTYFANGMYCREVFRRAGTVVIGRVHKQEHFFMLVEGQMRFASEDGEAHTVKAPYIAVCPPGTKRVTVALTDATVVTVHKVDSTDEQYIEKLIVEDMPDSPFTFGNQLKDEYKAAAFIETGRLECQSSG